MPPESTTLPAELMVDAQALNLLQRWIFILVKVGDEYVVPYTEARLRQVRECEDYPSTFIPFLERFSKTLTDPSWRPGNYFPGGWYRQQTARGQDALQAPITPEALGIFYGDEVRVDAEGAWWVGAKRITGNVLRFFLRSLAFDGDLARYVIRYPMETHVETRYVHHESPPFRVQAVLNGPGAPMLALNDESREPLRPDTLRLDSRERLYCAVKPQGLPAQFEDGPRWQLLDRLEATDTGWMLNWDGKAHRLRLRDPWRGADALPRPPAADAADGGGGR